MESDSLLSAHTLGDALADLICTYFVFDTAYPKSVYGLLIFFKLFVLGLKDNQKVPPSVSSLFFVAFVYHLHISSFVLVL